MTADEWPILIRGGAGSDSADVLCDAYPCDAVIDRGDASNVAELRTAVERHLTAHHPEPIEEPAR